MNIFEGILIVLWAAVVAYCLSYGASMKPAKKFAVILGSAVIVGLGILIL